MSAYIHIDIKQLIYNVRGEREGPVKLPDKEEAMSDPFHITLLSNPSTRKYKIFYFSKIGIKTVLVIHTENIKIRTHNLNVTLKIKNRRKKCMKYILHW